MLIMAEPAVLAPLAQAPTEQHKITFLVGKQLELATKIRLRGKRQLRRQEELQVAPDTKSLHQERNQEEEVLQQIHLQLLQVQLQLKTTQNEAKCRRS